MTAHSHLYGNCRSSLVVKDLTGGSISEFQSFSAYQGTNLTCPAGHPFCKGTLGTLYDDWKAGIYQENVFFETSVEDNAPGHTHTIDKKIVVLAMRNGLKVGGGTDNPENACDVLPTLCFPSNFNYRAISVELQEAVTGPPDVIYYEGEGYYHRHGIVNTSCYYNGLNYELITELTTCSLGHTGCRAITETLGENLWVISGYYSSPLSTDLFFDGGEPPGNEFSVATAGAGWTAEVETKTPPAYIDRTWALLSSELFSLTPSVLSQAAHGIYLGFNYGKTTNYGYTQWYNPPGGATKIYLPRLFSASIGGLQPGTTYHYRAFARLGGLLDVALLNGSIVLTGEYQGLPTECYFEWGETVEYGYETDLETMQYSGDFASIVTQLDPEITYHCRAVAKNALGTLYGEDVEFIVQGACYGEDQSFQTLAGLPPPVFGSGAGYEYQTAKEALEHVAKLSVGRGYGDGEGKFNYESRNVR